MKRSSILLIGLVCSLSSCSYQYANNIEQDDVNENDPYVYGVHKDSTAKQLKNVYTEKPELEKRVDAIRVKMYGGVPASAPVAAVVAAPVDSTKK